MKIVGLIGLYIISNWDPRSSSGMFPRLFRMRIIIPLQLRARQFRVITDDSHGVAEFRKEIKVEEIYSKHSMNHDFMYAGGGEEGIGGGYVTAATSFGRF